MVIKGDIQMKDKPVDLLADKIEERNNKQSIQADEPHDPIKPAHYRKGKIEIVEELEEE